MNRTWWNARIREAKGRYIRRCQRQPQRSYFFHPERNDGPLYDAWVKARIDYFNEERDKLYARSRRSSVCYLNGLLAAAERAKRT